MQDRLTQVVKEYLRDQGMEPVELKVSIGKRGPFVKLVIDQPEGVTIDDCVRVHKELRWTLQAQGIPSVGIEVSSPGPRRRLNIPEDLERFLGEPVRLVLSEPLNGLFVFTGNLVQVEKDRLRLALEEGKELEVMLCDIKRAHLWR